MASAVVPITAARRPRAVEWRRLELPTLEDFEDFLSELEEERWFARGRGDLAEVRAVTLIINETLRHRETVVQRARMRLLKGGRRG